MRILVTGATGLIGRQTVRVLSEAGNDVVAQSRSGSQVEGAELSHAADLLDQRDLEATVERAQAEALVHLAWYGGPGRMAAPDNIDWAAATLHLASSFAKAGGRQFLGAGSCAEYDWGAAGPLREDENLTPKSLYGITKLRTGQMLCEAALAMNLTVAWARIFFVYGPHEPRGRLMGDVVQGLLAGERVKCSTGEQVRDFLHSVDVATALHGLLKSKSPGAFNVASGQGIRVRTLIDEAARALDGEHLVDFGALERPKDDPDNLIADVSKLREATGFTPKFDIATGIAEIVQAEARDRIR